MVLRMAAAVRTGRGRRVATAAGVELIGVWGFIGVRGLDLMQAVVALSTGGLAWTTRPPLALTVFVVVCLESGALAVWLVRRRSLRPLRWPVWADLGVGMLAILSALWWTAPDQRISVWTMWAY